MLRIKLVSPSGQQQLLIKWHELQEDVAVIVDPLRTGLRNAPKRADENEDRRTVGGYDKCFKPVKNLVCILGWNTFDRKLVFSTQR